MNQAQTWSWGDQGMHVLPTHRADDQAPVLRLLIGESDGLPVETGTSSRFYIVVNAPASSGNSYNWAFPPYGPIKTSKKEPFGVTLSERELSPNFGSLLSIRREEACSAEDVVDVHRFLHTVYDSCQRDETQRAIDVILRFFDYAMINSKMLKCDEALRLLDPDRLGASMMMSVLCITEGLSHECPSRESFYARSISALTAQRGQEVAERLLRKHK